MQLTQSNILQHGKLIIGQVTDPYCECVFIFRQFRFFFSMRNNRNSPENLAASYCENIPDYVLDMLHRLVVAHTIFVDVIGLNSPLQEGGLYQTQIDYLDIYLDDIPVQRGLASNQIRITDEPVLATENLRNKSLKLVLHRNLSKNTLTPIHELFHLFQYAIVPFNNIWFMEGLARWGQRLMATSSPKEESLPTDHYALESILKKWHDAEFFWNRLDRLCRKDILIALPENLVECGLDVNITIASGQFMRTFLNHCKTQTQLLIQEQSSRQLVYNNEWSRLERRSANNNPYIIRAILKTIKDLNPKPSLELDTFLTLAKQYAYPAVSSCITQEYQALMLLLQKLKLGHVYQNNNGLLVSDYFEPITGTLSLNELKLKSKSISETELYPLSIVRNITGNLIIIDFPELTALIGLENIETIDGNLIIANTGVRHLNGFNQLEMVKGKIEIENNSKLRIINGFNTLDTIDNYLKISSNESLHTINGFNTLKEIKKGILTIEKSPLLSKINGFSSLIKVRGIDFNKLGISDVNFLANIFKQQPHYEGAIKITACQLEHLDGLANLVSTSSSLYLHGNKLKNLQGLESLVEVGASFSLSSNKLTDISNLHKLVRINGMLGLAFNQLETLNGLQNLKFIKTIKWNKEVRTLVFHENPRLTDISALQNIESEDKYMVIYTDDYNQYQKTPEIDSKFHENILEIHNFKTRKIIPTYNIINKKYQNYSHFRKATHNKNLVYISDLETYSNTLILSFSGLNGKLGGVFHNRFNLISGFIDTHKIFINDTNNIWYHGGIPGITRNIEETIDHLQEIVLGKTYDNILCIGTSMGGYMALLTGYILKATDIIAFAPQTFLDNENRKLYGDNRWKNQIKKLPSDIPEKYLDLSLLYRHKVNTTTQIQIHYGDHIKLDRIHVKHLGEHQNIKKYPYPVDDHYISIYLDKNNKLNDIISTTIKKYI